jgi:DNA-binding transcriptional LysR family regulator
VEAFIPFLAEESRRLRESHPELRVELLPSTGTLDLLRREADVALRMFRPKQAGLVARHVGQVGWSLFASEEYLARKGQLATLGDFSGHDIIAYDNDVKSAFGPRWLEEHAGAGNVVMRCDTVRGALLAIAQGVGIGTVPCFMAAGESSLRRMTPEVIANNEVFLLTAPDLQDLRRVRVVLEGVAGVFHRNRVLFAGKMA